MSDSGKGRVEFRSTPRMKELMAEAFARLRGEPGERRAPVAWCTSVGPVEPLRALGYEVYFPENHGAMLGASRMANHCMASAHARGYSQDICSYLTSDVGAYLAGQTPLSAYGLTGVPRADILVYSTNQCREVQDWFEFYGREWGVPVAGITSFRGVGEVTPTLVDAVAAQMEALVPRLESVAGTRLDAARLEAVLGLSRECSDLWKACLATAAHRPAPLTFFDSTIQMAPAVILRGTQAACDYYRLLLAELQERIREGVAAVEGERFRLYWDGMPMWGKLSEHARLFSQLRTCVVASTYCNSWIFDALDAADPFRSMARASLELFIARSDGPKEEYIGRMVRDFHADGLVFHDSRTCPHNSNTRFGMPRRLWQRWAIPSVTIEGDHNDLRCYSAEQSRTSLEGFVEQLAEP
jgi:benzoyl-CoA reductase/2-hydroxyglutaryl-CoA dehydratase subunit BcrC/BadD/HgdB